MSVALCWLASALQKHDLLPSFSQLTFTGRLSIIFTSAGFQLGGQNLPDLIDPGGFHIGSRRLKMVERIKKKNCSIETIGNLTQRD